MPRITAINVSKRRAQHMLVKVDGRTVGTLNIRSVGELGLQVDQDWTAKLAQQVAEAEAWDQTYEAALRKLDRRAMSKRHLAEKLEQLGYESHDIVQVLDRLETLRLLDDEAFGRELILATRRGRPAGQFLVRRKLLRGGLEEALIDRLLSEASSDPQQEQRDAEELATSKLPALRHLAPQVRKWRLWGALARRGFDTDTIEAALHALGQNDEPLD